MGDETVTAEERMILDRLTEQLGLQKSDTAALEGDVARRLGIRVHRPTDA